ncbi:MAG: TldD/PmbA family protein [Candidatus Obscuribacterales bacterium]|nr:TldD/PmbA family protein [Candidatus Obscuribacterales bacterium]
MITRAKAQSIIEHAINYAEGKVQSCELTLQSSDMATSRFANNSMTQNQAPERTELSLRVLKGGKQLRLSSDDLSPSAIRSLIDAAVSGIKLLEKDAGLLPLPAAVKHPYAAVGRFDKETAALSAAARAKAVKEIIEIASSRGLEAAGIVTSGSQLLAIGNSRGLFAFHKESHAECSITMNKNGATGWAKADELDFANLDYRGLAENAASKALANQEPLEIPPGKYRVILEPSAVLDLLSFLSWDFAATSHLDKLSCFIGQLGKKVFGENISITDDCLHPYQSGAPFDAEGLPRQSLKLVENGVLKQLVYGRRSAAKMGARPTGHGLSEPNAEGELPVNLVISGGNSSLEQMISSQERAVLLTRVWYIREVDPTLKIVTGMTRDGTFLVENGKITRAVKNLRFNQGLIELLNNVIELGASRRSAGEEGIPAVVPAMLVDNFNFSSTTTF